MRRADVWMGDRHAGALEELPGGRYRFVYDDDYQGPPVSLTLHPSQQVYEFDAFPPFFEGLLPEGMMLEGLLRQRKLDREDCFGQLLATGEELVGAVTVRPKS